MTQMVLDASVTLAWVFKDEFSEYATRIAAILHLDVAFVPAIWPMEVTNSILSATRRGRLAPYRAYDFLNEIGKLRIEIDREQHWQMVAQSALDGGLRYGVSAYDASYLDLALRRGLPLATQDRRLAEAALAAGIPMLEL
ncbi:MAG: type II toxin-antitoxin system VapC family toxin [Thermomicrobiales bacterium]